TGRKAPFRNIDLVGGYPQIRQDAVYFLDFIQSQVAFEVPEVGLYKSETRIIRHICPGILVLIKAIQTSLVKMFEYFPGVPATTKGQIDIGPIGIYGQTFDALV